jgi:hypothetical protein
VREDLRRDARLGDLGVGTREPLEQLVVPARPGAEQLAHAALRPGARVAEQGAQGARPVAGEPERRLQPVELFHHRPLELAVVPGAEERLVLAQVERRPDGPHGVPVQQLGRLVEVGGDQHPPVQQPPQRVRLVFLPAGAARPTPAPRRELRQDRQQRPPARAAGHVHDGAVQVVVDEDPPAPREAAGVRRQRQVHRRSLQRAYPTGS